MNKRYVPLFSFVTLFALAAMACVGLQSLGEQSAEQPAQVEEALSAQQSTAPDVRMDIPLMADAANVIAAETAEGYSVTYRSANSVDDVVAFYETQMPMFGWVYKAEVSTVAGGTSAVLAFDKGSERAAVTLNTTGTGTQVIIAVDPQAAGETPADAQPNQPEQPAASEPTPQPPAVSAEVRPDIPLMADASNVITADASEGYSVSYDSASSVDDVTAFYQSEMPALGWAYKAEISTVGGGVTAVLVFDKGDERAAVTLNSAGSGTQVVIGVEPGAADDGTAATTPTESPPSEPGTQLSALAGCDDIPLMADAANKGVIIEGEDCVVTYTSASGMDAAVAFYQAEMPKYGWNYNASISSVVGGVTALLYFDNGTQEVAVTVTPQGTAAQVVVAVEGGAAAGGDTGGDSGGESASTGSSGICQDIPLMADAAGVGTIVQGNDCVVTYTSVSGVDSVVSFYQAQMPEYGWTYNGNINSGGNMVLYFTKGGQEAAVTITNMVSAVQVVIAIEGGG